MLKTRFDKKFRELLKSVSRDLKAQANRLYFSGGVDTLDYGDDAELPKIIMVAALKDEAASFALTDDMVQVVKGLSSY